MHRLTIKRPSFLSPSWSLLLLILLVALGLRIYGVNWDSGYGFHPDERSLYMRAGCMYDVLTRAPGYGNCVLDFPETEPGIPGIKTFLDADRSPLNPHWFPLGSVLIYALVFIRSIIELFTNIDALDMRYAGRTLSALADVGSVFLVYLVGRRMFGQGVGLLAAALTALAVIHIQNSHFYRPETFSVFFTLGSFWAMLRMVERRRWRDSLLLGALVGLAMAPKVSVFLLAFPLALAYGYALLDSAGGRWSGITSQMVQKALYQAYAAGGTALGVFLVLTPYALLDYSTFIGDLVAQTNMAKLAGLLPFTVQYIDTPAFRYQIQQTAVWGLGLPLGVAAWLSLPFTAVMAIRNRDNRRGDLLLLAWVVPNLFFLESFEVKFLRYVFPLMPFMILMSARMLLWMVEHYGPAIRSASSDQEGAGKTGRLQGSRWLSSWPGGSWLSVGGVLRRAGLQLRPYLFGFSVALVVLVVGATAFYALAFTRVYGKEHPAITASRWIQENIPAGTSIISDNHWDEFIPGLYRYRVWQFPVYERDDPPKMETLVEKLADADYLVFYSNRPYGSVARVPEYFPLSSNYYQRLFRGELGYRLERTFTSYPQLLGVTFQDDPFDRAGLPRPKPLIPPTTSSLDLDLGYADDNVIGYDHPQVLLFRNVGKLPKGELSLLLLTIPSAVPLPSPDSLLQLRDRGEVGLLLSDEQRGAQRKGGTWSSIFNRDSWSNQLPVLAWLLAVELIYLTALPLSMVIFRPLPDRGIVLARVLGLLGIGYLTWLIISLGWVAFSGTAILVGFLAVGSLSGLALVIHWREIREFLARRWRLLLLAETLFLLAFLAFTMVRAANPDLWHPFRGGEKPMELAYLNAVVRSSTMPPYDPWFAGGYLNYYYWGYFVTALPLRITGILPTTGFNLAVPLFFALTVTGAYSLVYNLAEGVRRSRNRGDESLGGTPSEVSGNVDAVESLATTWTGTGSSVVSTPPRSPPADEEESPASRILESPVAAGLLAGLFVAVIGNLDGMVQLVQGAWHRVFRSEQVIPFFDYWRSSRMIPPTENFDPSPLAFWVPDKLIGAPDVSWHITEFPFFTFLFADLHAHMMVIPFTLLVIGLGLNLVVGLRSGSWSWIGVAGATLGLALGALWVINSWDYPPYLLLVMALLGLAVYFRSGSFPRKLAWFAALTVGVVGLSVLAFLPFHEAYETFNAGIAPSKWRTPMDRYLAIHGLFLFIVVTSLVYHARAILVQWFQDIFLRSDGATGARSLFGGPVWSRAFPVVWLAATIYLAVAGYWTAAAMMLLFFLTGLVTWRVLASQAPERPFAVVPLALLGMALAIGIGVDLVRLDGDIGRMNTLFKLYLEGWVLFSLASAYMLWHLAALGWLRWRWGWPKNLWVGVLALLLASSLIYTFLGTQDRLADRFNDGPLTLDGTAYLAKAVQREEGQKIELKWDLEAIQWLQDNVQGSPVELEAHHEQYHWSSRVADYTGLPTVLGWPWHQIQQRTAYDFAVRERSREIGEIYNTTDLLRAEQLLRKYEVEYIVVGELERAYYSPEGLAKFEKMVGNGLAKPVFGNNGVNIYQIIW